MLGEELLLVVEHNVVVNRGRLDRINSRQRMNYIAIRVAYVAGRLFMDSLAEPAYHLTYARYVRD